MPTVIHSGHVGELSPNFRDTPLRVIEKEPDAHKEAFDWLCEHAPLMDALSETSQSIRIETARIFVGSIWRRWPQLRDSGLDDTDLKKIITRQIVSYLAEHLSLPGKETPLHHLHEFYFYPPIRSERLYTGDLIRYEGDVYVIVTPQCNIAHKDPENFLLAKCQDLKDEWIAWKDKIDNNDGVPTGRIEQKLKSYATQGFEISRHFLPPCDKEGPWAVDFKIVISVSENKSEILKDARFASITPAFIPNLIQRFAAYLGRVGQPDLDTNELVTHIKNRD